MDLCAAFSWAPGLDQSHTFRKQHAVLIQLIHDRSLSPLPLLNPASITPLFLSNTTTHDPGRVSAASLNYPDALQIQGSYQDKPKLPFLLGKEASGVVTAVGGKVRGWRVGDAVCGVGDGGAFAEEWVVHKASVWRVPGEGSDGGLVGRVRWSGWVCRRALVASGAGGPQVITGRDR